MGIQFSNSFSSKSPSCRSRSRNYSRIFRLFTFISASPTNLLRSKTYKSQISRLKSFVLSCEQTNKFAKIEKLIEREMTGKTNQIYLYCLHCLVCFDVIGGPIFSNEIKCEFRQRKAFDKMFCKMQLLNSNVQSFWLLIIL